jgi:hypothetical protein
MDFGNMAVLGLTFLAPAAAILFFALRGERAQGTELKGSLVLFGLGMLVAAVGVARMDLPVKTELLWPLTLEQSGYFEFSLQPHWPRYVWIFFTSSLLLGFAVFDAPSAFESGRKKTRPLFLAGAYFSAVVAFLCENTLLSLMFVEMAAFMLHAFGIEEGGPNGELAKASYFKRACFLCLGLVMLLGIALSREFATGSVVLLGAALYVISTVVSKHNPSDWSELPLTLVHVGMALFLLERVTYGEASIEMWAPLAAVFAASAAVLAVISLLSPGNLSGVFWLGLSFLGYLLFLRFSSTKPADSFWGVYEAVGLSAAYGLGILFRFGERIDLLWKRAVAFVIVAIFLGILSGALPTVEITTTRFDSETSLLKMAALGLLTFLVSAVSAKGLVLSFGKQGTKPGNPRAFLMALVPSLLVLAVQVGALIRWNELNFEAVGSGGIPAMLYDLRVLVTTSTVCAGMLAGSLVGAKLRRGGWARNRELRMEELFPGIDPSLVQWNLRAVRLPEKGIDRISALVTTWGLRTANTVDLLDRRFFAEKLFRGFSESGASLSSMARYFHSGQVRAYLFLGVLVTLFSGLLFLVEGR